MTTRVIFRSKEKDAVVSGTHEKPKLKDLESTEPIRTMLIDFGDFSVLLDSVATGGEATNTRLFTLNAQNSEFVPEKESIYLPWVQKIQFEGSGKKEQR